ncbi:MAG: DUF5110 domain-containing protein [Lachnospiraceae bacterium]|nr:DUF5110 domain-containing protein [Lachnospiraceae bacterium]
MISAKRLLSYESGADSVKLCTDGTKLFVFFINENTVRVVTSFDEDYRELSYNLVTTAWEDDGDAFFGDMRRHITPLVPEVSEEDGVLSLSAPGCSVRVAVDRENFGLKFSDVDGRVLAEDIYGASYYKDGNLRRHHRGRIFEGDRFYGFGEKTGSLNKYGDRIRMYPSDAMGYDPEKTDPLYKHIPFFIRLNEKTGIASGMFYHNMSPAEFDMGRGKCNYFPEHYTYTADAGKLDYFFIAGPAISDVVESFTYLTGRQPLFPKYAYGYLGSSMYYSELPEKSDEAVLTFVDRAAEEGVTMTGFMLSSGYTTQADNKRCVFTWNSDRFPDPAGFVRKMKNKGVRISANVKPGFLKVHPMLSELKDEGFFIKDQYGESPETGFWWGGQGYFADLTSKKNREIWSRLLTENVLEYGIDSVWNDNCEVDSVIDDDAIVDAEGHPERLAGYRAVTANIMCRLAYEALLKKDPRKRPFVVCRAGGAGIQRFASTWAGDNLTCWEALQYNIGTILGMGLSGVANQGCDIGGFHGPVPEPELFVRWVQMGVFMPRFSIHSCNTDNTVTEPWMYEGIREEIREAIRLRYRLLPYIYSLMERSHTDGSPVMRPLLYKYQDDPKVYDEAVQFMMGDSLMVAPVVTKGAEGIEIYFPEGDDFIDLKTYERYEGGTCSVLPVTISDIPMFICRGGVFTEAEDMPVLEGSGRGIGFGNEDRAVGSLEPKKLLAYVYPRSVENYDVHTFYEDDGETMDHEDGVFLRSTMTISGGFDSEIVLDVKREGSYATFTEDILYTVFCEKAAPMAVYAGEWRLEQKLYAPDFYAAVDEKERAWYYDPDKRAVLITMPRPKGDYRLNISFQIHDLIGM